MTKFGQIKGFTLVETIAVIAVVGAIAAGVALFIRGPVLGYVDTVRRAGMTDTADTALRRIGRDLRLAVPNSVRVDNTGLALEFLLARSGGRYRAACANATTGDPLAFGDPSAYPCETASTANTFDVLGPTVAVATGDFIIVYNLGVPGADAWSGTTQSRRTFNGAAGSLSNISFAGTQFPFPSPSQRFQVAEGPVSYVCDPLPGTGTLMRYWGYPIAATQTVPPSGGSSAVLASNVSNCAFTYDALIVAQRAGLVTIRLAIQQGGETVTLYHAVHVSNVP